MDLGELRVQARLENSIKVKTKLKFVLNFFIIFPTLKLFWIRDQALSYTLSRNRVLNPVLAIRP